MRIAKLLYCYIAKKAGFTLVELLIVIAVVGVLSAGVITSINIVSKINSANIAKAKTFAASVENNLSINQVGKWSFEDGSGITAKDISGYSNNGTLSGGATWQTPSQCGLGLGGCLSFDGVSSRITVGDNDIFDLVSSFTIMAWIKPNNLDTGTIVRKPSAYSFYFTTTQGGLDIYNWSSDVRITCLKSKFTIGQWAHVAVSYNGTKATIYKDGTSCVSGTTANFGTTGTDVFIGGDTGLFFNGLIDEVSIYNQALSLAQIQELYAQGLGKHQLTRK